MANSFMPDNIINNILARLPAKPLMRSRCVSKHWNRLISDPHFMKSRSRRMIILSTSSTHLHLLDDNLPKTDNMAHSVVNLHPLVEFGEHVTVVGEFNGIVLLVLFKLSLFSDIILLPGHMILFNPLTRKLTRLPDPPSKINYYAHTFAFEFVYGATPDDLKIVRIEFHQSFDDDGDWGIYHVFDLKKSVWSKSRDLVPAYKFDFGMAGMFFNGFLYWVASKWVANQSDYVIVALNVKELVFSQIKFPSQCYGNTNFLLGSLDGCLCMISCKYNTFYVNVMNEQGVEKSWSKAYSFMFGLPSDYPSCIYIQDKGKFLIVGRGKLFVYDVTSEQPWKLLLDLEGCKSYEVHGIQYVESLVSRLGRSVRLNTFGYEIYLN